MMIQIVRNLLVVKQWKQKHVIHSNANGNHGINGQNVQKYVIQENNTGKENVIQMIFKIVMML